MAAFRLIPLFMQFTDDEGVILAGGSLTFSDSGGSTPRDVYGEPALSTNNGDVLTLSSAGRPSVDVWGSGNYRIILKDATDVVVATFDNVQSDSAAATAIPDPASGTAGQVIETNGTDYVLADILAVPDPTGMSGKQVGTDGTAVFWEAKQTIPTYTIPTGGVSVTDPKIVIGNHMIQIGTGTLPASGSTTASVGITFGTAMDSCQHVDVTFTQHLTDGGYAHFLIPEVTSMSGTGCTVTGCNNIYPGTISATITFTYVAWGLKAVA